MTSPEGGVTVLVVDDHPVVRHGMTALLEAEPWVGRVVAADSVATAQRMVLTERPDVAVVDLGLPDGDGVILIRRIRQSSPQCSVLVLTMNDDAVTVRNCLLAGASGYVLKETSPQTVVRAAETVADGGLVLGPNVHLDLVATRPAAVPAPFDQLAPRDLELLCLLAEGRSNRDIARVLSISDKTVRNRLSAVFVTLGVADRVQAALLTRDAGLTREAMENSSRRTTRITS